MAQDKRKAHIAVAGTSWWATYTHLPALQARSDVEVVALADVSLDRVRRSAENFGVSRTYADYREMIDREAIDGVVVSASQDVHYEIAHAGLDKGCHVLIEKPMVLHPSEALELVELARTKNLEIVMSYPWHYTPHVRRARDLVLAGKLGDVELMSSIFTSGVHRVLRGATSWKSQGTSDPGDSSALIRITHLAVLGSVDITS